MKIAEKRKCFDCRKPVKGMVLKCKDCKKKETKCTTGTYIIFDKI